MSGATAAVMAVTAVASAAMGVVGSIQSSNAQRQQNEYQSKMAQRNAQIAEQNAQMAEDEGREAKKLAHEESVLKRQEAAQMVGAQRALSGASGAQVDEGSALDATLDTVEKGEVEAMRIEQRGQWQDYDQRKNAWNMRNQRDNYLSKASALSMQSSDFPLTLINGALRSGKNIYSAMETYGKKNPSLKPEE